MHLRGFHFKILICGNHVTTISKTLSNRHCFMIFFGARLDLSKNPFKAEGVAVSQCYVHYTDCPLHPASVMRLCLYCKFFYIFFWVYSVGYKNNNNKIMQKDCHKFTVLRFRRMSLAPESRLAAEAVHSSNF